MRKKTISLILALTMMVTALTGCLAEELTLDFNPDGSGQATVALMMMDDFLEMSGKSADESFSDLEDGARLVHRTYNGVKYTGAEQSATFADAMDFNFSVAGDDNDRDDPATLRMIQDNRNGESLVTLYTQVAASDAISSQMEEQAGSVALPEPSVEEPALTQEALTEEDLNEEGQQALEAMGNLFRLDMTLTFPGGVKTVMGLEEDTYTIDGNTIRVSVTTGSIPQSFSITGVLGKAPKTPSLENLVPALDYQGQFKDVPADAWYSAALKNVYDRGIVAGTAEDAYSPERPLTRAQIIAMAARVCALYQGNEGTALVFPKLPRLPWYQGFVDYALQLGIIDPDTFADYAAPATRGEMALVLSRCLPEAELTAVNGAPAFTDVPADHPCAQAIAALYTAGVAAGTGSDTFSPDGPVTRAQAVVFLSRLILPDQRLTVSQ